MRPMKVDVSNTGSFKIHHWFGQADRIHMVISSQCYSAERALSNIASAPPHRRQAKTGEQQFALMLWSVLVHFSLWMLYSTVFCLSDFLTHSPKRRAVGGTGWYILLPNAPNRLDTVLCTTPCVLTISSSIRRSLIIKDDKMWTCKLQIVQFKSRQYRYVPKWFRRVALLMMTTRGTNRVRLSSQNTCGNTSAHASSNKENGFIFTSELHSVLSKI